MPPNPMLERLERTSEIPMQIALFTYSTKPRGSVIHTLELAEALQHLGHTVCVYALDKDGSGFGRSLTCAYQPVPASAAPAAIDQLIQQRIQEFVTFLDGHLANCQYEIFHAQDCLSANALAILRQQGKIPHFVRTVHHIEDYQSIYLQQCQQRSIEDADLCLCVSDYWQQQLAQQYHIHAPRVVNGVNRDRFAAPLPDPQPLRQQWGITGTPVFLTVGGIEPRKNTLQMLNAFAQVRQTLPHAQLVIAGGATLFDYQTYREQCLQRIKELELEQAIVLPGVIPDADLPSLYRCADSFVFPSVKEGWGLVVLEALASGLPVIVSQQAPFTEFLTPEQALFVDPSNPDTIAQAMLQSVQPQVAQALVQNSHTVLETYSWKTSATMHINHYQGFTHARNALQNSMA
ncbi:MSMEG_0565 family glycosyltransferase [Alkalinema sp. FACHB-956]|uniref:MSMEG_0565 family glycosyltransferase n=1 Tax=Alkalinema sp. FACHB-956 TaxID=2692768 RepID=UPI001F5595FD|nr:MSMEG_0565 family glycosyltransferase [Alkalinema sp. FACHB-956]